MIAALDGAEGATDVPKVGAVEHRAGSGLDVLMQRCELSHFDAPGFLASGDSTRCRLAQGTHDRKHSTTSATAQTLARIQKNLGDVPKRQELAPDEKTTTHRPADTSETMREKAAYVRAGVFALGEPVLGPDSMDCSVVAMRVFSY